MMFISFFFKFSKFQIEKMLFPQFWAIDDETEKCIQKIHQHFFLRLLIGKTRFLVMFFFYLKLNLNIEVLKEQRFEFLLGFIKYMIFIFNNIISNTNN